mgnify:FL=1
MLDSIIRLCILSYIEATLATNNTHKKHTP